ncbi:MAG: hypothetical protein AB4041_21510 [Microcystaceae cyanobacterium]
MNSFMKSYKQISPQHIYNVLGRSAINLKVVALLKSILLLSNFIPQFTDEEVNLSLEVLITPSS